MATDETCPHCSGVVARTDKTCPHCQRSLTATAASQQRLPATMPSSTMLLLLFGAIAMVGGIMLLTQATMGVGLICIGCFLAVWGRILQAGAHHHDNISVARER